MEEQEPQQKRRNPWLAGIGNLFYAPLGHVYAGQAWRGVLLYAAITVISFMAATALSRPVGRVGLLLMALVMMAAAVCLIGDAALVARQQGSSYRLKWYNRWYIYLLTIGISWISSQAIVFGIRTYIAQAYYIPSVAMTPTLQIGDRFLVDKLTYRWNSPERFDVVVFRAPPEVSPDEKDFVKRVIGEPGDTVEVVPDTVMVNGKPAVQLINSDASDPSYNFLNAEQRALFVERERAPEVQGSTLIVNGEPRVVVTPTGEAEYRDGQLWVNGQMTSSIGGREQVRTSNDLTPYGAAPEVQGVAYYDQHQDQPKLIVLKGQQLTVRPGHVKVNGQPLTEPYIRESLRYAMPPFKVPPGRYFVMGDNRNDSNDSHAWGPLARDRIIGVARTIFWSQDGGSGIRWERIGRPLN
jgi:signal peptidase I